MPSPANHVAAKSTNQTADSSANQNKKPAQKMAQNIEAEATSPAGGKQIRQTPRSSKTFSCPLCPERPPFRYRKSYDKHMQQHQYETLPLGMFPTVGGKPYVIPPLKAGGAGGGAGQGVTQPAKYDSESESDCMEYKDDPDDRDFKMRYRKKS